MPRFVVFYFYIGPLDLLKSNAHTAYINLINRVMKQIKSLIFAVATTATFALTPLVANANTSTYSFTLTWDTTNCRVLMNGSSGALNYNVPSGNSLQTTVSNQTGYSVSVIYAIASGGSYARSFASGTSDAGTFNSNQTTVSINPNLDSAVGYPTCTRQTSGYASFIGGGAVSGPTYPETAGGGTRTTTPQTNVSSTTSTSSTSAQSKTSAATPATTTSNSTSAPTVQLDKVLVANKVVATDKLIQITTNQQLKLMGHAAANTDITLTIHSTPRVVTAKTDAQGNWSYVLPKLAQGSHSVTASLANADNQTSPAITLLNFHVKSVPAATVLKTQGNIKTPLAIGVGVIIVLLITASAVIARRKGFFKQKSKATPAATENNQPADTDTKK